MLGVLASPQVAQWLASILAEPDAETAALMVETLAAGVAGQLSLQGLDDAQASAGGRLLAAKVARARTTFRECAGEG